MSKTRTIKSYESLDEELLEQIKLHYPQGFAKNLIRFRDIRGNLTSALPFETDEKIYLIRMTKSEAIEIIDDDDDYDDEGILLDEVREDYAVKYDEEDEELDDEDFDLLDD